MTVQPFFGLWLSANASESRCLVVLLLIHPTFPKSCFSWHLDPRKQIRVAKLVVFS